MIKEYAVYKGEDLLCIGTLSECASKLNVKPSTILWYRHSSYQNRSKKNKNRRIVVEI